MPAITNTTQLSTFDLLKSVITDDAVLSVKFNDSNIHEFDPKTKGGSATFPYIVISIPSTDTTLEVMSHETTVKEFSTSIFMVLEWSARSNLKTLASRLVFAFEAAEDTLSASGYYDAKLELITSGSETFNQKEVVVAEFLLVDDGTVHR